MKMSSGNILIINTCDDLSTGNIAYNIGKYVSEGLNKDFVFFAKECNSRKKEVIELKNSFFGKITSCFNGSDGLSGQKRNTKIVCNYISKNCPSVIHIHNVHGRFINVFEILKLAEHKNIPIIWTVHDEWLLTNRCAYALNCDGYVNDCKKCEHLDYYPKCLIDNHGKNLLLKKKIMAYKNICFVTPSHALEDKLKSQYPKANVMTINNGVDTEIFKLDTKHFSKNKNDKRIILCVASKWNMLKGIDIVFDLAKKLDESYIINLVGDASKYETMLNNTRNINYYPSLDKSNLVEMYNKADYFFIPSRLDNYPTVIIEASCCGLPTIGFNVGGVGELINKDFGALLPLQPKTNIDDVISNLTKIKMSIDDKKALSELSIEKYNYKNRFQEYLNLYKKILNNK